MLRGEGTGLVALWWGSGRFNLDGGNAKGLEHDESAPKPPGTLISGRDFVNYGCAPRTEYQPCWYVQYLDNELREGHTSVDTAGHMKRRVPVVRPHPVRRAFPCLVRLSRTTLRGTPHWETTP